MSHISLFDAQARDDACEATPAPGAVTKNVSHFFSARSARPTPRRFLGSAAPSCRRFRFAPDLMAGVEEDEHPEVVRGVTLSGFFGLYLRLRFLETPRDV